MFFVLRVKAERVITFEFWAFSHLIVGLLTNERLLHFECGSFSFKRGSFVNGEVLNFKCVSHSLSSTIEPPIIIVSLSCQCFEF